MKEESTKDPYHRSCCWGWSAQWNSTLSSFGVLLFFLIANIQCIKSIPENKLPPVTQEGKNTFGCRVNGVNWTPYAECGFMSPPCRELSFFAGPVDSVHKLPLRFTLSVERVIGDNTFSDFRFETHWLFPINQVGNKFDSLSIGYDKNEDHYEQAYQSYTSGAVKITKLDTVNNFIAGTFSFTLYNSNGDSVVVTDGRFDLGYNACLCH